MDGIVNPTPYDLNVYITTGAYSIGNSELYGNIPIKKYGTLIVRKCGIYILQEYNAANFYAWRISPDNGSTWENWSTAVVHTDLPVFVVNGNRQTSVEIHYERDATGGFLRLRDSSGKDIAYWRETGAY